MEENFNVDLDENLKLKEVPKPTTKQRSKKVVKEVIERPAHEEELINCLRNEKVIVRHIPKLQGIWGNNPKHVLAGGMAENAVKTFVVPRLSSGMYVNVLTDAEKAFLEEAMGLEYNALSIYRKEDNFWDDRNETGINKVSLTKQDTYLDLSNPEDYIRYKILLANKDFIAPSIKAYEDMPKATYQFIIIEENEENKVAKANMSMTMKCYKEYGKIEEDKDTLRVIVELIEGKPLAANTKLEFLQTRVNSLIQANNKLFYSTITDPLLKTKVLIVKSVENGLIANRDGKFYLKVDNSPLCNDGENATLNNAAKFLNLHKNQETLLYLQAKLNT